MSPLLHARQLLVRFSRRYLATMLLASFLMLLSSAALLAVPWFAGNLTDAVVWSESGSMSPMTVLGVIVAALVLQQIARAVGGYLLWRTSDRLVRDLRVALFERTLATPMAVFDRQPAGRWLSLLSQDCATIAGFLSGTVPGLVPTLMTLIGALVIVLLDQATLGLVLMASLLPVLVIAILWSRRMRKLSRQYHEVQENAIKHAEESLENIRVVRAYGLDAREKQRFEAQQREALSISESLRLRITPIGAMVQLILIGAVTLFLAFASDALSQGELSPGELVRLLLYGALVARPLASVADSIARYQSAMGATARVAEAFSAVPEATDNRRKLVVSRGAVAFHDVHFAYADGMPVLKGFSLEVAPGEVLALCGDNGSGKSTALRLLLAFYVPQQGAISIDGQDLSDVSAASLREHIAWVPQTVRLASCTLADNIRWGDPGADDDAVAAAATAAGLDPLIKSLPAGLETDLGSRGATLSGGQRQRVALARALIKDAPILLLDEATAQFDQESEREFVAHARQSISGRTVILVTHNPEVAALADRVVRLSNGRIEA